MSFWRSLKIGLGASTTPVDVVTVCVDLTIDPARLPAADVVLVPIRCDQRAQTVRAVLRAIRRVGLQSRVVVAVHPEWSWLADEVLRAARGRAVHTEVRVLPRHHV